MSSLSAALNIALSGLTATSVQSAVVSRNVASANDPDYTRRTAALMTLPGGSVSVASYDRSADKRLLDKLLSVTSSSSGKDAVTAALGELSQTIGDPESDSSITSLMGQLQQALRGYEADPSNATLAASAFQAASGLAQGLNNAATAVQDTRRAADQAMQQSVSNINSLLRSFKVANDAVVNGAGTPGELADSLDQRDSLLKQLSQEIGIRTVTRANNDIAIYTDSGITLFETTPRSVSMAPTDTFTAGVSGNPVVVDGVRLTGDPTAMGGKTGKLVGLAQVRDGLAVTYQKQLDEVARGLITQFSEHAAGQPDVPGLFTYDGAPAMPAAGAAGLAASLTANALADPAKGGNPSLIRDGGFGGAAYVSNTAGASGYQDHLADLITGLDAPFSFDGGAQLGTGMSLIGFSAGASGWVEAQRQQATASADADQAMKTRASDALQRVTGVNIDEEMTTLLDLEKSYQASAKVMTAVDGMLQNLLDAVGR